MMGNPKTFCDEVKAYRAENIPAKALKLLQPILAMEQFTFENIVKKSSACANLCKWVINVVRYNAIYKKVKASVENKEEYHAQVEEQPSSPPKSASPKKSSGPQKVSIGGNHKVRL